MSIEPLAAYVSRINDCQKCSDEEFCDDCWNEGAMVHDVAELIPNLIKDIEDDWIDDGDEDNGPGMDITIGSNDGSVWAYQTGDNSFMGSCYLFRYWGVGRLYRDTDPMVCARYLVDQIFEQIAENS